MSKNKVSDVLNNSLVLFDDVCFLNKQFVSIDFLKKNGRLLSDEDFVGMLCHHKEFRQHIVDEAVSGNYDIERFFMEDVEAYSEAFKNLSHVPFDLFSWNHYSRRVLSLSKDIQLLLSATSLEGFTWQDIKLPFESFVVVLANPIVGLEDKKYDCILVNRMLLRDSDDYSLNFTLFPSDFDKYKSLNKAKIARSVKRGRAKKGKIHKKRLHLAGGIVDGFSFQFKGNFNISLSDTVESVSKPSVSYEEDVFIPVKNRKIGCNSDEDEYIAYSVYSKVFHLILNVCFHMAFIPPQQTIRHHVHNRKDIQPDPIDAITCPNEIFSIGSENDISDTAREAVSEIIKSRKSGNKCVHWRRGHWRRKWGSYGDENAPKTWISPCLVNRGKLPDGSLPMASKSNL